MKNKERVTRDGHPNLSRETISDASGDKCVCVCVCVVIPFILDVRLVDVPAGVTQDLSAFLVQCLP